MKIHKKVALLATCILSITFCKTTYAADYKVVPNDSLYKISLLFNTPINTLMSDNNLNSNIIYPSQVLYVRAESYTVKSGDTLYLIASRYGFSVSELMRANNKWDSHLIPGQMLVLPSLKPKSATATVVPYTQSEVNLLARLIQAEAGGESYTAMVAVGGVVVNRVQNPEWPSSISEVINQKIGIYYQFTPVENGYIKNPPSDESLRAAWAALYGSDPSNEAMFYYDDSTTNEWIRSKTVSARIDSMIFAQ